MMKNAPSDKTKRVSVSFQSSKDRSLSPAELLYCKEEAKPQSQENLRNKYTNAVT